jgi:hypothetical protein
MDTPLKKGEKMLDLYEPLVLACERLGPLVRELRADGVSNDAICDGLVGAVGLLYLDNGDQDDTAERVNAQLEGILSNQELRDSPLFAALMDLVRG